MSRIRSIHPGFFTDEDLVSVSMAARMLFLGLGVEADDKGIFEWKPLTIKMRVFPADNIDVPALMDELAQAGAILRYEIGGKSYGAIRNFRKFQKPKTPNDIHPATAEILAFVGLVSEMNDAQPASFPPKGETVLPKAEKSFQMEDGGGNGSSVANATAADGVIDPEKIMFDAGVALLKASGKSETAARSWLGKAKKVHGAEAVITAIGRAKREGAMEPIAFMEGCLQGKARAGPSAVVGI